MPLLKYALILCSLVIAQADDPAPGSDDPLEVARRQLKDANRTVEERGSIALEAAAALDKRAEGADSPESRSKLSIAAITLLDEFNAANPRNPLEVPIAIQAAVYLWADARRSIDDAKLAAAPVDATLRNHAKEELDATIARFIRIEPGLSGVEPLIAQNARFRAAQAQVDRAGLAPPRSQEETEHLKAALAQLEPMPSEASVAGYAYLLRADIRVRQKQFHDAGEDLDEANKSKSPPPAAAFLEVKVAQLIGEGRFQSAIEAIDAGKLEPVTAAVLGVRARVAEHKAISAGVQRRDADADALKRAQPLRTSQRVDARMALIDLAQAIENPSPHFEPEEFDTLADGWIASGNVTRASTLIEKAADNATSSGKLKEGARLRLRAGALLFQDGQYAEADAIFTRMWGDSRTGADRPKAGMLRVLARGRALAENVPGATPDAYFQAMQALVKDYPNDPAVGEARWLLGQAEAENGQLDKALAHWHAIAPGQPRWLSARLAIVRNDEEALDNLRIAEDRAGIKKTYENISQFLKKSIDAVPGTSDAIELEIAQVRLDLRPEVARGAQALEACESLEKRAASEAQHLAVRGLKIVALAESSRFSEAEREARTWGMKISDNELRNIAKLLDHASDTTENDSNRARFGRLVLRLLGDLPAKRKEEVAPAIAAELNLRFVRAQIATGATDAARKTFAGPSAPNAALLDADGLRDLADAFIRLEAYAMAIDVERMRAKSLKPGSAAWIESRYGLALSLYRSRKAAEARRLIDATEVLHEDLGGPALKEKFVRLRQRMEPE